MKAIALWSSRMMNQRHKFLEDEVDIWCVMSVCAARGVKRLVYQRILVYQTAESEKKDEML